MIAGSLMMQILRAPIAEQAIAGYISEDPTKNVG
jgi:hypothetical protein